jgi:hypothetical protein
MNTPGKSYIDYLVNSLELDGPALENWLSDLDRDEPGMAQRIRAALAMRETPEFEEFLAGITNTRRLTVRARGRERRPGVPERPDSRPVGGSL